MSRGLTNDLSQGLLSSSLHDHLNRDRRVKAKPLRGRLRALTWWSRPEEWQPRRGRARSREQDEHRSAGYTWDKPEPEVRAVAFPKVMPSVPVAAVMVCKTVGLHV